MRLQLEEKIGTSQKLRQGIAVTSMLVGFGFLGLSAFVFLSNPSGTKNTTGQTEQSRPHRQPLGKTVAAKTDGRDILVKYRPSRINLRQVSKGGQVRMKSLESEHRLKQVDQLVEDNIVQYRADANASVSLTVSSLQRNPEVESVQINYQYTPLTNDPRFGEQWALQNTGQTISGWTGTAGADINASAAWAVAPNLPSVVVAVIDSGVEYNHPDLANMMWDGTACVDDMNLALGNCLHGYDFEDNDLDPLPTYTTHGTLVAGVIAAQSNNSLGISGVAPNAKIMALKVNLTTLEIIRAIRFAEHNGAKIINASWGGGYYDLLLNTAIENYPGLFVTAAGNWGAEHGTYGYNEYPCDYTLDNIVCVTASDQDDDLPYWADVGNVSVDLAAPGETILSSSTSESMYDENFNSVTAPALPAGWTATGTFGTRPSPYSMNSLYGDAVNASYAPNADSTVTSPVKNLSGATGATLEFYNGCDTEYTADWNDYMSIEMKNIPVYQTPTFLRTWGTAGTGNSQFNSPTDGAIDVDGNVYVVDAGNARIQKFDSAGNFLISWGGSGVANGKFSAPTEIAVDRLGNVYVHDTGNNRIQKFDSNGAYLTSWSTYGQVYGFTLDAAGYVYEVDYPHLKVNIYESNGALLNDWAPSSDVSGAKHIAVDTSGNVYLTYQSIGLIKAFTNEGMLMAQWGSLGSGNGQFGTISGISVDDQKNIYVSDSQLHRVQVFTNTGTLLGAWGASGTGNSQFAIPSGPSFGPDGEIVVVDKNNNRVQVFSPAAAILNSDWTEMARWNEKSLEDNTNQTDETLGYQAIDIPSSALTASFQFRFRWITNAENNGTVGDGCWVDFLGLTSIGGGSTDKYEFTEGTSFATPHVAGVAAMVLGSRPTLTTAQLKQYVVESGDLVPAFAGLTVSGKRLDAYRALMFPQTAQLSNVPDSVTKITSANITVSGFDVVNYRYAVDGGAYSADIPVAQPIVLSGLSEGTHSLLVLGQDSGNVRQSENYPTRVDWQIDNTSPTGTITYSSTGPTTSWVTAILSTSEPVTVTNNYGYNSKTFYSNGSFIFTFIDRAGLTGSAVATVLNIDKIAPIGTVTYSTTAPTSTSVTATLVTNEPVKIYNNGGSPIYTFTSNGTFIYYYEDLAGNYSTTTATVSNILSAPIATVSQAPSGPTAGPVTLTLNTSEPVTLNNGGRSKIRMYNNGTLRFDIRHSPVALSVSSTVTNIITPKITTSLKVTKGVFKEGAVTIRPFMKNTDGVIGRRVSFGDLGTINMFLASKPTKLAPVAVYNKSGKNLQFLSLPDDMKSKGVNSAISRDIAVNKVHLAVAPNKNGKTVALYEVLPNGLRPMPKLTVATKAGTVAVVFKKLFADQQRLITYVNNNVATVRVWRYEVSIGKYVQDSTYSRKNFTISPGKFSYNPSTYVDPTYTGAGTPAVKLTAPTILANYFIFYASVLDRPMDVYFDWGPTPELGTTWDYGTYTEAKRYMALPAEKGQVISYRVRACNAGTTVCTTTPIYTVEGK